MPILPEIKVVNDAVTLERICKFRYSIYIEELGDTYEGVDEKAASLRDELDEFGIVLYAEDQGRLIATCRINLGCHGPFSDYWRECYDLQKFPHHNALCLASKMMVAPQWRGTLLGFSFLIKAMQITKSYGGQFVFLDCIPPLVPLYENIGFRRYKSNAPEEKNLKYYIPLVAVLDDAEYLKQINSRGYQYMLAEQNDEKTARWFNRSFPKGFGYIKESLQPYSALKDYIKQLIPFEKIHLLNNMQEDQIRKLLRAGTILHGKKGETLCFAGDSGDEMYVLLRGKMLITDAGKKLLYQVGAGENLGYENFLKSKYRQLNATALSDFTVLCLSQRIKKSLARDHHLGKVFYKNLLMSALREKNELCKNRGSNP